MMLRRSLIQMKRHIRPNLAVQLDFSSMPGSNLGIAAIQGGQKFRRSDLDTAMLVSLRAEGGVPPRTDGLSTHLTSVLGSIRFVSFVLQDELRHVAAPGHEVDHSETAGMSR